MTRRHPPLPRLWLMTDERMGDALWPALKRLPKGSGVIFRHHANSAAERRALYEAVRRIARKRSLILILAGSPRQAIGWRADGSHGRSAHRRAPGPLLRTAPAHNARELHAARHADLILLSPAFPTRSHPGAPALGRARFGLLAARAKKPVIALGGMDERRARSLPGIYGWAAIDAWTRRSATR